MGLENPRLLMSKAVRSVVIAASAQIALMVSGVASHALAASPVEVTNFGSNPGNLIMFKYVPDRVNNPAPLVVVLHGCAQESPRFAEKAGWMQIADRMGLVLAIPGQKTENEPGNCFRWPDPADIERDKGEALSIKQMVDKLKSDHNINSKRVYVAGLSAGGAMTSVMLATYPDIFAGGGIVAGIPYRCAENLLDAQECMKTGHPLKLSGSSDGTFTPKEWGDRVREASNYSGPFPKVSIWHGSADKVVNPINGSEQVEQWTNVHGLLHNNPSEVDTIKGFPHQVFKDANGNTLVESIIVTGMDHGDPIDPGTGPDQCGTPDAFVLDVNICSSFFIAKFWGLSPNYP
jgi:poly(hydroxyalkanoate) depolymerase family esterase